MTDDAALSRELTAVVSGVDGVGEVYSPAPLIQQVTVDLLTAAIDAAAADAKVGIARGSDGTVTVSVNIGVIADHPVPAVLRAASEAIRAHLELVETLAAPPVIEVKASRVHDNGFFV